MLYYLHLYLLENIAGTAWEEPLSGLRLFRYISVRSIGAAFTALLLSWMLAPFVIHRLKGLKFQQNYLDKAEKDGGLKRDIDKTGTPTMGGVLIVLALYLSALLWAQWSAFVLLALLSIVVLSALGFYDDFLKVKAQNGEGVKSNFKLFVQGTLALIVIWFLWRAPETRDLVADFTVPFFKKPVLENALWLGVPIIMLTIVGSSNAVNLSDGLDGLAIGCAIILSMVFIVLTYVSGHSEFASYLQLSHIRGAGELTIVCSAILGASVGFLWYNCHPAQIFMGDTGALALGGAFGIMAVLVHQPLILLIAGGVFVAEALSVILQVACYKYNMKRFGVGRRLFLQAPLHHHFEKKGWHESKVVTRFYILSGLCAGLALLTLKIR